MVMLDLSQRNKNSSTRAIQYNNNINRIKYNKYAIVKTNEGNAYNKNQYLSMLNKIHIEVSVEENMTEAIQDIVYVI